MIDAVVGEMGSEALTDDQQPAQRYFDGGSGSGANDQRSKLVAALHYCYMAWHRICQRTWHPVAVAVS